MLLYQVLAYNIHAKTQESHTKTINLKCHLQCRMKSLSYQMNKVLYQIFKIISSISPKKMKQ